MLLRKVSQAETASRIDRSIVARELRVAAKARPALTGPARGGREIWRSGRKNARGAGRTKEWTRYATYVARPNSG